jgi:hypothetical protein
VRRTTDWCDFHSALADRAATYIPTTAAATYAAPPFETPVVVLRSAPVGVRS